MMVCTHCRNQPTSHSFHRKFRAAIVKLVDKVLGFPLVGNMQLLHVVLMLTGASFAETIRQTVHLQSKRASEMVETPNVVTGAVVITDGIHGVDYRCIIHSCVSSYTLSFPTNKGLLARRWRAERNFWLSFFCFTLWCLLAAFYRYGTWVSNSACMNNCW